MPQLLPRIVPLLLATLTAACASVPASRESTLRSGQALTLVANERHRRIEQYVDASALANAPRFALPQVRIAAQAHAAQISAAQASLVANHAARSLCQALSRYAVIEAQAGERTLDAQLVVTSILPTSGAAAGASSVLGFFVPGPFRLPAGLGALAIDAQLMALDGQQVAAMRWARGANAVTNDAKVSSIGDAWQLADQFGSEFARALLDTDLEKAGMQRQRVDAPTAKTNRALCANRFGTVNLAGRGASLLLPLAPEAIDPGPPADAADSAAGSSDALQARAAAGDPRPAD